MRKDLEQIFMAGLNRVNPYGMITSHVALKGNALVVEMEDFNLTVDLDLYDRILILGAGKASAPMARAFETILGDRIDTGLICVKYGHTDALERVEIVEAAHPVPDQNGVQAAKRIAALAQQADEKTLIINCISGGGSALLPYPMDNNTSSNLVELTLEDKQQTTSALLRCGADITEINCVRKHISGIKGGRLLQMQYPARSLNFILSDVIGDDLGSIASGATSCDMTTFADARNIIRRYNLCSDIPEVVLQALDLGVDGKICETAKADDPALTRADNILIGTNRHALIAAADKARQMGYNVLPLTAQLGGEARHAARFLADIAKDAVSSDMLVQKPACIIAGGETVVTLQGNGKGGRNQEIALTFLNDLGRWTDGTENVHFLAASTDGNDGPTDAAGAFADMEAWKRCLEDRENTEDALANNDSYNLFDRIDGLFKTGPTNTNVCDLQIALIVDPAEKEESSLD